MGLGEGTPTQRENLEQADHAEIGDDGSSHQRTYAQCATDFGVDTWIVVRILARNEEAAAHAFSRQPLVYVDGGSERRRRFAGSRAADHFVFRKNCLLYTSVPSSEIQR